MCGSEFHSTYLFFTPDASVQPWLHTAGAPDASPAEGWSILKQRMLLRETSGRSHQEQRRVDGHFTRGTEAAKHSPHHPHCIYCESSIYWRQEPAPQVFMLTMRTGAQPWHGGPFSIRDWQTVRCVSALPSVLACLSTCASSRTDCDRQHLCKELQSQH